MPIRKLPVFLNPQESTRIINAAKTPRDRLIIQIGLYLGLRVAEIVGLRIERIDFAAGHLLVHRSKTGDRYSPIPSKMLKPLKAWIGNRKTGWVFPSRKKPGYHIITRTVQLMVESCAKRAGITRPDPTQRISPHKLRHSYATALLRKGADIFTVKELLGHASIATTQIYLHCDTERLRDAVERL